MAEAANAPQATPEPKPNKGKPPHNGAKAAAGKEAPKAKEVVEMLGEEPTPEMREALLSLSAEVGTPVLVVAHGVGGTIQSVRDWLSEPLCDELQACIRESCKRGTRMTVVLHSPGGSARAAYRMARFLQGYCGGFVTIVPSFAKSAATLWALGSERIIMGDFAELGPLDVQVDDADREKQMSALEMVQSVERLHAEALRAIDGQMALWAQRSQKKLEFLLPLASHFVAELMAPLFEKIDAVQFTTMARQLKVGQDYAERLMAPRYTPQRAGQVASQLTEAYSDHGFIIDREEAIGIGIECEAPTGTLAPIVDVLSCMMPDDERLLGILRREGPGNETKA